MSADDCPCLLCRPWQYRMQVVGVAGWFWLGAPGVKHLALAVDGPSEGAIPR